MQIQTDAQTASSFVAIFFIRCVRSWKELLQLLYPSELQMMGLVILNKVLGLYMTMLRLWWVQCIFIALLVLEQTYHAVPVVILTAYGLYILLLARSSVPVKNIRYLFASQKTITAIFLLVTLGAINLISWQTPLWASLLLGWHQYIIILSPVTRLVVLTAYDAYSQLRPQMRALLRAGTIFLYHYPFFIMVYLIAWYLLYPMIAYPLLWAAGYVPYLQPVVSALALMIWIPWYSAAVVYGYTRFVREHMDYYYE